MKKFKCWKKESPVAQSIGESRVESWQNKKTKDTVIIHDLDDGYGVSISPINGQPKMIGKSILKSEKAAIRKAEEYMKKHDKC